MDQAPDTLFDDSRVPPGMLEVDDYYRLAREGFFQGKPGVELIEGGLAWMNAIGSPHAGVVNRLNGILVRAAGDRATVSVQNPVRLDRRNEPQPDVALLRPRADSYGTGHPSPGDVLLLIEVADSSLAFDRGRKRALYARFGIPEYWVVDIDGGQVEVCRDPVPTGYATLEPAGADAVLTVARLPDIAVPVRDVLG